VDGNFGNFKSGIETRLFGLGLLPEKHPCVVQEFLNRSKKRGVVVNFLKITSFLFRVLIFLLFLSVLFPFLSIP
jgi:hypothetical protein